MTGVRKSRFARIFGGSAGLDPYTMAVSDVYQDLFGVGTFTGKGIYDVDAFEQAVGRYLPRKSHPEPRPDRGRLRPLRTGHGHRIARRFSRLRTWSSPGANIAGRAATGRFCRGSFRACPAPARSDAAQPVARGRTLEDLRQPAPQSGAAGADRAADPGMDGVARLALVVDRGGPGRRGLAPVASIGEHSFPNCARSLLAGQRA